MGNEYFAFISSSLSLPPPPSLSLSNLLPVPRIGPLQLEARDSFLHDAFYRSQSTGRWELIRTDKGRERTRKNKYITQHNRYKNITGRRLFLFKEITTSDLLAITIILPYMLRDWTCTTISEMCFYMSVKKVNLLYRVHFYEIILYQSYSDRIRIPHILQSHKE